MRRSTQFLHALAAAAGFALFLAAAPAIAADPPAGSATS
jgi:hypothetical protein